MALGRFSPFPIRFGGGQPIAAAWLDEIKAGLTDAFTDAPGTLVTAENIALARLLAAGTLACEKLKNNSIPNTSHDLLLDWADRLGVPVNSEMSEAEIRDACSAKYLLTSGCTISALNDSLRALLGQNFINVTYFYGIDLDNPPDPTVWDGYVDPLYDSLNLGDGVWLSQRAHLLICVSQPSWMSLDEFLILMNVQLYNLLNTSLPAWATFDWNLGLYEDGFILDDPGSLLDFTAL